MRGSIDTSKGECTPWDDIALSIRSAVVRDGVECISDCAFLVFVFGSVQIPSQSSPSEMKHFADVMNWNQLQSQILLSTSGTVHSDSAISRRSRSPDQ